MRRSKVPGTSHQDRRSIRTTNDANALVVDGPQFGGEVVEIEGGAKLEVVADAEVDSVGLAVVVRAVLVGWSGWSGGTMGWRGVPMLWCGGGLGGAAREWGGVV